MENSRNHNSLFFQQEFCGRSGFNLWVGKISWRRERLSTPVFWPGEFHGLHSPGASQRVGLSLSPPTPSSISSISTLLLIYLWWHLSLLNAVDSLLYISLYHQFKRRIFHCKLPLEKSPIQHPWKMLTSVSLWTCLGSGCLWLLIPNSSKFYLVLPYTKPKRAISGPNSALWAAASSQFLSMDSLLHTRELQ